MVDAMKLQHTAAIIPLHVTRRILTLFVSTRQRENDMNRAQMMRETFTIAAVAFLCGTAATTEPPVTVVSPCECLDARGKGRWAVKTDSSLPPIDASAIQAVVPSDVFGWPGIDVSLTWQSERTGIENKWFALTGRVVAVKVEADGDLHIALQEKYGFGTLEETRDVMRANLKRAIQDVALSKTSDRY